jgi:hypothetical protein
MSEQYIPVSLLTIRINIVPFGTTQIIESHDNECSAMVDRNDKKTVYEFPTGSVIGGSIIYDQPLLYSTSP